MMKKNILLLFTVLSGVVMQAQTNFKTGLRGGFNMSYIEDVESTGRAGFYAGAFGTINFGKFYTMQPELNFTTQGAKDVWLSADYFPETQGGKTDVPLNYLGFALMNKFNLQSFFLQAGPSFEILLNNSRYTRNKFDFNLNMGLGYDITDYLSVEGRYKIGVADVINDDSFIYIFQQVNYNSVFQVGMIYKFD
ncbi:MAG TPA: porin family protein [Flavobacterium sp.]|nr:porin family protein [Flavobacterium sp.]